MYKGKKKIEVQSLRIYSFQGKLTVKQFNCLGMY